MSFFSALKAISRACLFFIIASAILVLFTVLPPGLLTTFTQLAAELLVQQPEERLLPLGQALLLGDDLLDLLAVVGYHGELNIVRRCQLAAGTIFTSVYSEFKLEKLWLASPVDRVAH